MIRCMVIDDEPLAIQVLEKYLSEAPGFTIVHKCRNAIEAFELLKLENIDLMFLDIEMPLVNGIELLKTIKNPPPTIFTTAYREYAFDAYELNIIDYLLKPIAYERFTIAIEKFKERFKARNSEEDQYLLVKNRQGLVKVAYKDIVYISACKDYVKVLTGAKSFLVLKTMKEMLKELGGRFIRVHRSFIVPMDRIKIIKSDSILLTDDKVMPLGSVYYKDVLDSFRK